MKPEKFTAENTEKKNFRFFKSSVNSAGHSRHTVKSCFLIFAPQGTNDNRWSHEVTFDIQVYLVS